MVARLQRHVGGRIEDAARRRHRGAVRHLRRTRARLLQSEDPSRAADLSRHSRGGERVAIDRAARARAPRRRPASEPSRSRGLRRLSTRSSSPRRARSSATRRSRAACMRSLRSPEVMFDVAAEADLVWELSRLCRSRAIEGIETRLHAERAALPERRSARLQRSGIQRERGQIDPRARRHRDHRAHGDQGLSEVPRASARPSASAAFASPSTTPAAATPASARSPTSSRTSSSSTSR